MPDPRLQSTLTCPHCGHLATETMPMNACVAFYDCKGCGETLKPLPGSCCVFCSYGSVPCPPIQQSLAALQYPTGVPKIGLEALALAYWRGGSLTPWYWEVYSSLSPRERPFGLLSSFGWEPRARSTRDDLGAPTAGSPDHTILR
jgi:hypothetical protein